MMRLTSVSHLPDGIELKPKHLCVGSDTEYCINVTEVAYEILFLSCRLQGEESLSL